MGSDWSAECIIKLKINDFLTNSWCGIWYNPSGHVATLLCNAAGLIAMKGCAPLSQLPLINTGLYSGKPCGPCVIG